MLSLVVNENDVNIKSKQNEDQYIKMFWVGLMDGDGNIQVNHWHKKALQYRLIIKLNNTKCNYSMLIRIAKVIGGIVRIVNDKSEVVWLVDNKETVIKIIHIFVKYPPLTTRLTCQLEFLKVCLSNNSVNLYLKNRNLKYSNQLNLIKSFNENFIVPHHFPSWLSGFIEAEGCFSLRLKQNHSFSIEQNEDYYLLHAINKFLNLSVMIRNPNKKIFLLESYKKETLHRIINHCKSYPLLGEKAQSLDKFIKVF